MDGEFVYYAPPPPRETEVEASRFGRALESFTRSGGKHIEDQNFWDAPGLVGQDGLWYEVGYPSLKTNEGEVNRHHGVTEEKLIMAESMQGNRQLAENCWDPSSDFNDGGSPNYSDSKSEASAHWESGETPLEVQADGKKSRRKKKKNKPRDKNIAACKAYREREKRRREELEVANERLEKERDSYVAQIKELRDQAERLRNGGEVNLAVENELLRADIRKHKAFVQSIISIATEGSTSEESRKDVLRQGIDAGVGQAIGLAVTSARNTDWKIGKPISVGGWQLPVKYLYFPDDVPQEQATRLSFRLEFRDFPMSVEEFNKRTLSVYSNTAMLNRIYESFRQEAACDRIVQQVYPTEKDSESIDAGTFLSGDIHNLDGDERTQQDIRVIRLISTQENGDKEMGSVLEDFEALYITAFKSTKIHPSALWGDSRMCSEPRHALVSVQTSSSSSQLIDEEDNKCGSGLIRQEAQHLLGTIVQSSEVDPDYCNAVIVSTCPIGDRKYLGVMGKQYPSFDEEGRMDAIYQTKLDKLFQMAFM